MPRPWLANLCDAEKLSNEKLMQIKGLHDHDAFVTAPMPCFALIGALVDFHSPGNRGPARD
jgi:hypothetical protein